MTYPIPDIISNTMPDSARIVKSPQELSASLLDTHAKVFLNLINISTGITTDAEKLLRDAGVGISLKEWDTLAGTVAYGPIRPSELLRKVVLTGTPQTLSGVIDRLEGKGLVVRSPSPDSTRAVLVSATAQGIDLANEVFPVIDRKLITPFNLHFSDEEHQLLGTLLDRL